MRPALLAALACALLAAAPGNARAQGSDVLLEAAGRGDVAAVRAQLARGALVEARDARSWTALMIASARGHTRVVQALLAVGANPSSRATDGSTPLMAAAVGGHRDIVRALLDAGADTSLRNQAGATAQSKALEYGHADLAALIEARGRAVGATTSAEPAPTPSPAPTAFEDPSRFDVQELEEVHVLARDASLRKEPSLTAPVVTQLPRGMELRVTGRVVGRPWYRVGPAERAVYVESEALRSSTP
jgi:ankyrin repeat protein